MNPRDTLNRMRTITMSITTTTINPSPTSEPP